MKTSKHALIFALTGFFVNAGITAHAEPANLVSTLQSTDIVSYVPLVIFGVSAIVVYLANRPRSSMCPRARRRTDSSRSEAHT